MTIDTALALFGACSILALAFALIAPQFSEMGKGSNL